MAAGAAADNTVFKTYQDLFPQLQGSNVDNPDLCTVLLSLQDISRYAADAYRSPDARAFTENTRRPSQQIEYLDRGLANDAIEGVLRIKLESGSGIVDNDGLFGGVSDPFVVFTAGTSRELSEPVENARNPTWNATFHLVIRRQHLSVDFRNELHIQLNDRDEQSGVLSVANLVNQNDTLGSAVLDLDSLKQPGIQEHDLAIPGRSGDSAGTLSFTTEFLPANEAFDIGPAQPWPVNPPKQDPTYWIQNEGRLNLVPYAFVNDTEYGTQVSQSLPLDVCDSSVFQAWVHVNKAIKTLLIAFRGTETDALSDVLADVNVDKDEPLSLKQTNLLLKPSASLVEARVFVHRGFLRAYECVRETLLQIAYDLCCWASDWKVMITGHSLGGALASLCAYDFGNRCNADGTHPTVVMASFGGPRVGNADFSRHYNSTCPETFRVVQHDDVIPTLPSVRYVHTAKELIFQRDNAILIEGHRPENFDIKSVVVNSREDGEVNEQVSGTVNVALQSRLNVGRMSDQHSMEDYSASIDHAVDRFLGIMAA